MPKVSEIENKEQLIKYLDENYPEAFYYFFFGNKYRWQPSEIDNLDFRLANCLIKLEELLDKESEQEDSPQQSKKFKNIPFIGDGEWSNMSVNEILKTESFKQKQEMNEKLLDQMRESSLRKVLE